MKQILSFIIWFKKLIFRELTKFTLIFILINNKFNCYCKLFLIIRISFNQKTHTLLNEIKMQEKIIKDEILEKMSLENVFKIVNDNVFPILNDQERAFCKELQEFCLELRPKIDKSKDVYELFPVLGKEGYIQRINLFKDFRPYGMKTEVLLATHLSCLDSQLELARLASGILCGNPTFHFLQHGHESEAIRRVQEELISGQKIGCIGITEPERGSDAVNMTTICTRTEEGVIFNGEKVYTTNGPKADYFVAYGVTNNANPRGTMIQAMLKREFGVETRRLKIDYVPRVHIAHTIFKDVSCPNDYILGGEGQGYRNLFENLVPERLGIMGSGLGICWAALAYGIIYTNLRLQFGQPILKYQGVGFSLADLLSRTSAATALAFQAASIYDEHILFSEKPSKEAEKWVAGISSQGKYLVARLSADLTYNIQQQMGGISVTDNTDIQELSSTSYIEEVIGGARNIAHMNAILETSNSSLYKTPYDIIPDYNKNFFLFFFMWSQISLCRQKYPFTLNTHPLDSSISHLFRISRKHDS